LITAQRGAGIATRPKRLIFTSIQKVCVRQENESLQGNPIMMTDREDSLLICEIDVLSLQLAALLDNLEQMQSE